MGIEPVSLWMRRKASKRVRVVRRGEGDRVAAGLAHCKHAAGRAGLPDQQVSLQPNKQSLIRFEE
jgi:hypothetical protein